MKKSLLVLLLCATLSFAENKFYLGVGAGSGSGEYIYSDDAGVNTVSKSDQEIRDLKFGVIIEHNNRVEFSFSKLDVDLIASNNVDKTVTSINADFVLTLDFGQKDLVFIPFLTVGAGYSFWDGSENLTANNQVLMGTSINYGAGVLLSLTDNIDIELAYKGKKIVWQEIVEVPSGKVVNVEDDVAVTYVGVHFNF